MDLDVRDRRARQVELKLLPAATVIERNEHAELGARIEKTLTHRILTDHARRMMRWDSVVARCEQSPALPIVLRLVDEWPEVPQQGAVTREIRLGGVVRRRVDRLDPAFRRHVGWGHVLPGTAAVA